MFLFLDLDLKFLKDRVGPRRTLSVLPTFNKYLEGCEESKTTVLYFGFQVGIAACQIARAYGLKVLGTAGTEEGQNIVLQNGAHEVFNHRELNYIDKIKVKLFHNFIEVDFISWETYFFLVNSFFLTNHSLNVVCFFFFSLFMPICVLQF